MSPPLLQSAAQLSRDGRPFVMATVVAANGRTPRDAGARMIWLPGPAGAGGPSAGDSPASSPAPPAAPNILGTVGGGRMEQLVIEACERHFASRSSGIEKLSLLQDADQCCGGTMEVFIEYLGPTSRVVLFGAGHVAMALAGLLAESAIEVVIADNRPEWNTVERFRRCRRVLSWAEGVALAGEHPADTSACVMTYDHDTDFDLLISLLKLADRRPAYLGLIGSRSKRSCFWGRLSAQGIPQEVIENIECPMGLGDMGKAPLEVAVSIAGRLLLEAKKRAPRR